MGISVASNLQPLPSRFVLNAVNKLSVHSVLLGQRCYSAVLASFKRLAYFQHLVRREFIRVVTLSVEHGRRAVASFGEHIVHIVIMRAQKQMVRVNTTTDITSVAYVGAFRYRPNVRKPRSSVRRRVPFVPTSKLNLPIAAAVQAAPPKPASIGFSCFSQKSVDQTDSASHGIMLPEYAPKDKL